MIGNPNSEEARDSYASWQLAIAVLREKGVRSGLYAPRADHPDELRWAAEGPRPPIIRGVKNEFYPCKPDIFAMTYESVEQ